MEAVHRRRFHSLVAAFMWIQRTRGEEGRGERGLCLRLLFALCDGTVAGE